MTFAYTIFYIQLFRRMLLELTENIHTDLDFFGKDNLMYFEMMTIKWIYLGEKKKNNLCKYWRKTKIQLKSFINEI